MNRIAIKSKENVLKEGPQVVSDFASIFLMAASFLVVITESFGKSYQDPFSDFQEEAPLNIGNKPADLLEQTKEYCIMPWIDKKMTVIYWSKAANWVWYWNIAHDGRYM